MGVSKKRVIIDTDPGVDDAMAIFLALESEELDVIGLTTIFGNVRTPMATQNALHLLEVAGREDIPVAQGLSTSLKGVAKERIADFVHGLDGLGNTYPLPPKGKAVDLSAPEFLNEKVNTDPGEVTVVALGPLTNVAKAMTDNPSFATNVAQIIVLGGAFFVNGNVNPAAEANIFGDPEAADIVFTSGANIVVVGLNITHQVILTGSDLKQWRDSKGKYSQYLYNISQFYFSYHREAYDIDAIYLHDPTTVVAAIDPSLLTYAEGVIRVQEEGICRGMTCFDNKKKWDSQTEWSGHPTVKVAVTVNAPSVVRIIKQRCFGLQER